MPCHMPALRTFLKYQDGFFHHQDLSQYTCDGVIINSESTCLSSSPKKEQSFFGHSRNAPRPHDPRHDCLVPRFVSLAPAPLPKSRRHSTMSKSAVFSRLQGPLPPRGAGRPCESQLVLKASGPSQQYSLPFSACRQVFVFTCVGRAESKPMLHAMVLLVIACQNAAWIHKHCSLARREDPWRSSISQSRDCSPVASDRSPKQVTLYTIGLFRTRGKVLYQD